MDKMRCFYLGFPFLFFMISSLHSIRGQACFVSLEISENGNTDLIGLEAVQDNPEIEDLSCQVRSALPIEFQNDFKVYDYSFYHHMKSQNINLEQEFSEVINMASEASKFYLLFGKKITADQGVDFYVDLKLPLVPGCFEEEHISFRELQIKNELLRNSGFTYLTNLAEVLRELQKHIEYLTKECCYSSFKNSCSGFWCDYKSSLSEDYGLTDQDLIQWYDEPDNHDLRCNLTELYDNETEMDADFKRAVSRFIIAYHKTTKNLFYSLSDVDESNIPEIHDDIIRSGLDAFLPNYLEFKVDYFNAFKFQFFHHIDLEEFSTIDHLDYDDSKVNEKTSNFGDWFRDSWASVKGTGDIINKAIVIANEIKQQFATTLTPILAYGAEIVWAITKFAVLEISGINDILEIYEGINLLQKPESIPACTKIGLGLLAIIPWSKVGKVFYKMGGIFRSIYQFWGNLLNGFSKVFDYFGEIAGKLSYEAGEFLVEKVGKKMNLGFLCRIFDLGCFVKNTPVLMASNPFKIAATGIAFATMPLVAPIQDVQVDDMVKAFHHKEMYLAASNDADDIYVPGWQDYDYINITPETWQVGEFIIEEADGSIVEIEANRPKKWFQNYGLKVKGDNAFIVIEEMGVADYAVLQAIRSTDIDTRNFVVDENGQVDRPVITTYKRIANEITDYTFSNGQIISCTPNHPFYSLDRQVYLPVGDLTFGETVQTAGEREVKFIGSKAREKGEHVYNFEVWREHNYYVGFDGSDEFLLVHNNCLDNAAEAGVKSKLINEAGHEFFEEVFDEVGAEVAEQAIKKGRKLSWTEVKALFIRGNDFNKKARTNNWWPEHEITVIHPTKKYPAGHAKAGQPRRYRLDSYDHNLGKRVSRKATDFDEVSEQTWKNYINELDSKYPVGATIKKPGSPLNNQHLNGEKIIEVPDSNVGSAKQTAFEQIAAEKNVTVVYKPE